MICTAAERDLIVAGATRLVVAGDPGCEGCHDRITHAKIHGDAGWVAPQRWVEATGPCPLLGPEPLHRHSCRHCIDGRKRVALQVATNGNPHDEHQAGCVLHNLPPNELWPSPLNCSCGGVVTFAYCSVAIEPNDDGRTFTIVLSNVELAP